MAQKGHFSKTRKLCSTISDLPFPEITPYQYFQYFFPDKIITGSVEQINLYSYQKKQKNIKTTEEQIKSLIGVMIKIVIVSLPSCKWGVLRDLVLFVQFKKREKHP